VLPADLAQSCAEPTQTAETSSVAAAPAAPAALRPLPLPAPVARRPALADTGGLGPAGGACSGGSSGRLVRAPLAAVAGVVAAVWLGLRERDRRARKQRSLTARTSGLARQLAAGFGCRRGAHPAGAERTQVAAAGARQHGRRHPRRPLRLACSRPVGRPRRRAGGEDRAQAAKQRQQLSRTAATTAREAAKQRRQLAARRPVPARLSRSGGSCPAGLPSGGALTGGSRQLRAAPPPALPTRRRGSAVTDSTRSSPRPSRLSPRGPLGGAARSAGPSGGSSGTRCSLRCGAGYVAGARAGRERYDEIVELATRTAEQPEVRRVPRR
jgi:hypothetical protein